MNKKQSTVSIAIGVACVWMGTHFGPGVASGTQILVYWVKYGLWGAVAAILAMGLLGYCIYCSAEFSRIYKTYNYADWTREVWGIKWIVYLLDFSFIIVMMTALGGSLNAIGTLLSNEFGLNYWIGIGLVIIAAALPIRLLVLMGIISHFFPEVNTFHYREQQNMGYSVILLTLFRALDMK